MLQTGTVGGKYPYSSTDNKSMLIYVGQKFAHISISPNWAFT